jgi:hypothetical protein
MSAFENATIFLKLLMAQKAGRDVKSTSLMVRSLVRRANP